MFETQFIQLVDAVLSEDEGAEFLKSLAQNAITGDMLAFAARTLHQRMTPLHYPGPLLDPCGTGGDRQCTLNISTAAAFVLAGAGVKIAKHGNRAVSSTSGSSDVLTELGVQPDMPADLVVQCLDEVNLGFCFAPRFHPRLRSLAPLRKKLGIPTIFNWLGPLCNPARPQYQVLGVGQPEMRLPVSQALAQLNVHRAVVVHGEPGLDEVSLQGRTSVSLIEQGRISEHTWTPEDFGLQQANIEEIRCRNVQESARHIVAILQNEEIPGRNWVLANAAVGLLLAEHVNSLQDGVQLAAEVVRSGNAWRCLQKLQALSAASVRPAPADG